jgi:hypothetical protein
MEEKEVKTKSILNDSGTKKTKKLDSKEKAKYDKYKQKYFEYYDDVKSHTHDIYDW